MRTQSSPRSIFTVCSTGCTDTVRVMSQSDPRALKQNNNSSPGFYPTDFNIIMTKQHPLQEYLLNLSKSV